MSEEQSEEQTGRRQGEYDYRAPVLIVTGFLGSGKTTLLNRLLQQPALANAAVAINEFGDIGLDDRFLDHEQDGVLTMANGCVCCVIKNDFEDQILRVFTRPEKRQQPLSSLVIETSGIADPSPMMQFLLGSPLAARVFKLAAVVCTIDAVFAPRQLREHPEAIHQAAIADRLVLTKSDLPEAKVAAVKELLAEINPRAELFEAVDGQIEAARLFGPGQPSEWSSSSEALQWLASPERAPRGPAAGHGHGVESFTLSADKILDWQRFSRWMTSVRVKWSEQLLRVKGIVHVSSERHPLAIHGVHHIFHSPVELTRWPGGERRSQIVFITRGASRQEIEAGFEQMRRG